jgi:post-segregation antitoxin (ccd killing protein)
MDRATSPTPASYQGRFECVAKLSASLPDDLLRDLRAVSPDNVSAFVAAAVRHELDRRRLHAFVEELIEELGPSDEAEVVRYNELFAAAAAARTDRKTCV